MPKSLLEEYKKRKTRETCTMYSTELPGFITVVSTYKDDPYMFCWNGIYLDLNTLEPIYNQEVTEQQLQEVKALLNSQNKFGFHTCIWDVAKFIWKAFQDSKR